jgi:hypothetical protein
LDLSVNNLIGNLNDPRVEKALTLLHGCGLTQLVLGGGDVSLAGTLGPVWTSFTNLQQLIITKASLEGTIPEAIGNLTSLQELDLNGGCRFLGTDILTDTHTVADAWCMVHPFTRVAGPM